MNIMIGACAKYVVSAVLVALLVSIAKLAFAGTASLSGENLLPTVATSASGSATIHVGADKSITGSVTVSGLQPTGVHNHAGGTGDIGPVVVTLTRSSDDVWLIPAGVVLNDANFASYQKGELFVDVHTSAHPGGEIRAQVGP